MEKSSYGALGVGGFFLIAIIAAFVYKAQQSTPAAIFSVSPTASIQIPKNSSPSIVITPSNAPLPSTRYMPPMQTKIDELTASMAAAILPLPPREVRLESVNNSSSRVTWKGTGEDGILYKVYKKQGPMEWNEIATVEMTGDNTGSYSMQVHYEGSGIAEFYGVRATKPFYGNQSEIVQAW